MKHLKIQICMGSSCYARGNAKNAEIAQEWIAAHPGSPVELSGTLCEGHCKDGPIVRIGEKLSTGVNPESLGELLGETLGSR